jgi:hypothetical protein
VTVGYNYGKEYGGHLAACMIMNCVANRVRNGWGSWLEVIDSIPKYAAEEKVFNKLPSIWDQNFIKLLTEVDGIYEGSAKDLSCGATYWCDTRKITRDWFLKEIVRSNNYEASANMTSLTCYRPIQRLDAKEHAALYGRG